MCLYLHGKPSFDALKLLQVLNKACKKDRNFHTSELARTHPTCVHDICVYVRIKHVLLSMHAFFWCVHVLKCMNGLFFLQIISSSFVYFSKNIEEICIMIVI